MGVQQSINNKVEGMQKEVKEQVMKQMMIQREIQMAVNIAKARDSLQWFGGIRH